MRRLLSLAACLIALVLPWRARIWYTGLLAWMAQGVSFVVFRLLRLLARNLPARGRP